ncbi:MAG: SDR family NAD(P)-dependent oxidoreductase [Solirubrobacterales bacterium]
MKLEGRTALLTGATGGLGCAIAAELAGRGATLILSARDQGDLDQLAGSLRGDAHRAIAADLLGDGEVERLMGEAGAHDVLIANAGIGGGEAIEDDDHDAIARVVRLNVEVPAQMAASSLATMVPRDEGHLVFISSLAGKVIPSGSALYAATKAGLRAFALGLADDLSDSGVDVSSIYPGFVRDAGMFADSGAKPPPGIGTASPQDVADAVADAIEEERREADVAPLQQRSFANFAFHFHSLSARMERAAGTTDFVKRVKRRSGG